MLYNNEMNVPETGCACGKDHACGIQEVILGKGVIAKLPETVKKYGTKPFILDDVNTRAAAGDKVRELLADMKYSAHTFPDKHVFPNNDSVGSAIMNFDLSCDVIVAVGSGVIGDIAKILAATSRRPLITVGTAPSMDGFASATSSMCRDKLKFSVPSTVPVAIIGDTDILKNAPARMIASGVGDMAAKYISLAEWKIAHLITGEYYCKAVDDAMAKALSIVADNADGISRRDENAIGALTEGLILAGIAMSWAGVSRPASGLEHYFSHVWDMRAEEFGTPTDFHGIQCGVATLLCLKLYEKLRRVTPDKEKALAHAKAFDKEAHFNFLRQLLGAAAEPMIASEVKEKKYDAALHEKRIDRIIEKWNDICAVIDTMPSYSEVEALLKKVGAPTTAEEIGLGDCVSDAFRASGDVRYKYIASHLLWDMGEHIEI